MLLIPPVYSFSYIPILSSEIEATEDSTVPLRPRSPSSDIVVNPAPRQPSISIERRVSTVNEAYIQFVQTLLKECKLKVRSIDLKTWDKRLDLIYIDMLYT